MIHREATSQFGNVSMLAKSGRTMAKLDTLGFAVAITTTLVEIAACSAISSSVLFVGGWHMTSQAGTLGASYSAQRWHSSSSICDARRAETRARGCRRCQGHRPFVWLLDDARAAVIAVVVAHESFSPNKARRFRSGTCHCLRRSRVHEFMTL